MVTPANRVIARAGFKLCWAPGTLGFLQYFLPNTSKDEKNSYVSAGLLAQCHMLNPSLVIALNLQKVRWGPRLATFWIKILNFTRVIRLKWLANITLWDLQLPESMLLLTGHLNCGPFKYYCREPIQIGWQKLNGGTHPPGSILLLGAHLNRGLFRYYCRGAHLNWLAKIKLRGPGLLE